MKRPLIVGVMGGSKADEDTCQHAYALGALIAQQGWVLLNGGRNAGVMAASARGAVDHGGLTIGILPDADTDRTSEFIMIPICTAMGSARNVINILSSDIVVACPGGPGTVSEIALALKHGKYVITLGFNVGTFFNGLPDCQHASLMEAQTPEEVIRLIRERSHAGFSQK